MKDIDGYAYLSKLRGLSPNQKVFLSGSALAMCLVSECLSLYIIVTSMMIYLIVVKGGTPLKLVLKLMSIPVGFLILSLLTILFEISKSPNEFIIAIPMLGAYIGCTLPGLIQALFLFCKVMASVSCLYFLSLTTPLTDLLGVLKRLRCPSFLIELMMLIYRFIFVLIEVAYTMQYSQSSRLGYRNLKIGLRSFGLLISSVLVKAIKINNDLYIALESRGYNGNLRVLSQVDYWSMSYRKLILIESLLIGVILLERSLF